MRLRPRESTWLDMLLLAADSGCLVRTRPDWQGEREGRRGERHEVERKKKKDKKKNHKLSDHFVAKGSRDAGSQC